MFPSLDLGESEYLCFLIWRELFLCCRKFQKPKKVEMIKIQKLRSLDKMSLYKLGLLANFIESMKLGRDENADL